MRPLELVINGFRSYDEETRFDWRDRHLVGVVGPIGSGKSSILDAIAFALYGKTPSFAGNTSALINQRQQLAQVQLTFRVDGHAWQVVRAIRRTGQGNHVLYPFDETTGEVDRGAGVSGQKAVTDRVEQLIGLDFDAFRRSVLLAQNRFAEFLNATATERDKVLQGVFNLDRITAMQLVARDRLHEADRDAGDLAQQVAEVAAARTRVLERNAERQSQAARHASLEALRPQIEEHTRVEQETRQQALAARQRITTLDEMRGGLPPREESKQTIEGFATLAAAVTQQRAARERAEATEAAARVAREAALTEAGGPERLEAAASALQAQQHARTTHDDRTQQQAAARVALDAAQTSAQASAETAKVSTVLAKRAETAQTEAEAAVTAADEALHAAERLDFAITLRGGLANGDDCPVCGRKIAKLPPGEASPDLEHAEAARETARAALVTASAATKQARDASARDAATAAAVSKQIEATTTALATTEDALTLAATARTEADKLVQKLLGKGDAAARLATLRANLAVADTALAEATRSAQTTREAEAIATKTHDSGRKALTALRIRLATVAGTLGVEVVEDDSPTAVQALLDGVRARWLAEHNAATEGERAANEAADAAATRRVAALLASGLPENASFDEAASEVKQRVAILDALIAEDERRVSDAADAEQRAQAIEARRDVTVFRAIELLRSGQAVPKTASR